MVGWRREERGPAVVEWVLIEEGEDGRMKGTNAVVFPGREEQRQRQ